MTDFTPRSILSPILSKVYDIDNDSLNVSLVSGEISAGDITVDIPQAPEDDPVGSDGTIIGLEARSTQKTAVDEGDCVIPVALLTGEQIFAGYNYSTGHIDIDNEYITNSYDAGNTALKVNVVASSASTAIDTGSGVIEADTTRTVAATDSPEVANQTDGSQKTQIVDGSGNVIGSTSNALDVNVASGVSLDVSLSNANDDVLVYGWDGSDNQKLKTDSDGHAQVDILSSALPTGAATESTLSTLDGKVTACNTGDVTVSSQPALDSGTDSVSSVQSGTWNINNIAGTISLPTGAATESTLSTLDGKVTVCNTGAVTISSALPAGNNNIGNVDIVTLPGTVESDIGSIKTAVELLDNAIAGSEMQVDIVSQPALDSATDSISSVQSGTWNINNVSGTISLPTGAATESTLSTLDGKVTACNTGDVTIGSAIPAGDNNIGNVDIVTLPGTVEADISAIKTAVELIDNTVSGSELQVDVVSSALPTGAATESTLSTLNGKIAECNTGAVTVSSMPNLSSASDSVSAVQSGTWNITNISGTVSLPTGAATESSLSDAVTALQIMDDWDESDRCAVNLISSQTGVDGGNGAVSAATQRVTLASDSPGMASFDASMPSAGIAIGAYATDTRKTAVDAGDIVELVTNLYGELVTAAYDWVGQFNRTAEQDPLDSRDKYPILCEVTNGTDGTYYYYIDMERFREAGLQLILDGGSGTVTVTIEGTMEGTGEAAADCTYSDVSSLWGASDWTADDILTDGDKVAGQFKYLRAKVVADTSDADDADWTIYSSKGY